MWTEGLSTGGFRQIPLHRRAESQLSRSVFRGGGGACGSCDLHPGCAAAGYGSGHLPLQRLSSAAGYRDPVPAAGASRTNTRRIVKYLAAHPQVKSVSHPSLPDHPQHELYQKYFPRAEVPFFTFRVRGGEEQARRWIDHLEIFSLLANVADMKSLVIHPATTTPCPADGGGTGTAGDLPRHRPPLHRNEHVEDLIADRIRLLTRSPSDICRCQPLLSDRSAGRPWRWRCRERSHPWRMCCVVPNLPLTGSCPLGGLECSGGGGQLFRPASGRRSGGCSPACRCRCRLRFGRSSRPRRPRR